MLIDTRSKECMENSMSTYLDISVDELYQYIDYASDILPVPGEGSGGGPLNTPDPDPFDWDLPDGMEKYGESPYL